MGSMRENTWIKISAPEDEMHSNVDPLHGYVTIAQVGSVPEGQAVPIVVQGRMLALFCVDGEYSALDDFCPHMGASLSAGYVEDREVICPWHAWRFCVKEGTWCDNPSVKTETFPVRVVGDEIQVRIPPRA